MATMAKKNTKQGSDRPKQQFDERRDERGKLTDNTWHGGYISLSLSLSLTGKNRVLLEDSQNGRKKKKEKRLCTNLFFPSSALHPSV